MAGTIESVEGDCQIIGTSSSPCGRGGHRAWPDVVVVMLIGGAVFVVHPVTYVLHHPYWGDEAWVAVLSKAPFSQWPSLVSSTPIGWLLVVRWVPAGRDGLRVVALAFSAAGVVIAYAIVRCLPWKTATAARFAGTVAGLVVLLAPVSLLRNDLKQYTSDAFFALVVIALACRVDNEPSRRNLLWMVVGSAVAIVFSAAAAFVVAAVFLAFAIVAVTSRSPRRIAEVAVAGVTIAVAVGCYFAVVVLPKDNRALRDYWRPYYLPLRLTTISIAWQRLNHLEPVVGMPAWVFVGLVATGVFVLAGFRRPSVALAVPILWVEMLVAGMTSRYPFLDVRTSHFLLILSLTVAAIGVAGIASAAASRSRVLAGFLIVGVALGLFHGAEPYVRVRSLRNEDVRTQVLTVARHMRPGDVILVSYMSDWGFTYYWPGGHRRYSVDHSAKSANGFLTRLDDQPNVVYAVGRDEPDTIIAMSHAVALTRKPSSTKRIWLIGTHVSTSENKAWTRTFSAFGLSTRTRIGPELLTLIDTTTAIARP